MYDVAPVAGRKIEAAYTLSSFRQIMGQITSTHSNNNNNQSSSYINRHHPNQKSKSHYRHSAVQPLRKEEMVILRDSLKDPSDIYRGAAARESIHLRKNKDLPNGRPVTISEMNAYNIEKSEEHSPLMKLSDNLSVIDKEIIIKTTNASDELSTPPAVQLTLPPKVNEFYTVDDGYHKTDSCYYRTPDGNFHKLPTDSYHKMSEGCYIKSPDGTFRRLDISRNMNGSGQLAKVTSTNGGGQPKMRSQMMKFLKRSKSHTPATIKELQKEKERRERDRERERKHRASATPNAESSISGSSYNASKNNKVVVTMIENGGLPIVATSKTERMKHSNKDASGCATDKTRNQKVRKVNAKRPNSGRNRKQKH